MSRLDLYSIRVARLSVKRPRPRRFVETLDADRNRASCPGTRGQDRCITRGTLCALSIRPARPLSARPSGDSRSCEPVNPVIDTGRAIRRIAELRSGKIQIGRQLGEVFTLTRRTGSSCENAKTLCEGRIDQKEGVPLTRDPVRVAGHRRGRTRTDAEQRAKASTIRLTRLLRLVRLAALPPLTLRESRKATAAAPSG